MEEGRREGRNTEHGNTETRKHGTRNKRKEEEGRRKEEEGRRKKEGGRRKKEEEQTHTPQHKNQSTLFGGKSTHLLSKAKSYKQRVIFPQHDQSLQNIEKDHIPVITPFYFLALYTQSLSQHLQNGSRHLEFVARGNRSTFHY